MQEHIPQDDARDSMVIEADEQQPTRRIIKRERRRDDEPTPLAFVITGQGRQPQHPVTVARWSEAAFRHLRSLAEAFKQENPRISIPVVGLLRGRLELTDQNTLRLERDLGLKYHELKYHELKYHELLWTQTDGETCREHINEAVLGWLTNDVARHGQSKAAERSIEQLKQLARKRQAVEAFRRNASPYQWDVSLGKTAKAISPSSYADLADYVARQIEGKEIFPELPGLRRIVSGQLEQNQAELMTDPISLGRGGRFSLVVRVHVFSYPGRPTPVIVIGFSRRIWTSGLKEKSSPNTISGYALPEGSTRALRFTLRKAKGEDGTWGYQPDADFAPIERRYFTGKPLTIDKILKDGHRLPKCKLLVVLKHGAGERSEAKSGVPDRDEREHAK
jgi:argonaute-like protein